MTKDFELSSDQTDMLEELINISFGLSASIVGNMLDSYAHLSIPKVALIDINNLGEHIRKSFPPENTFYITKQLFKGNIYGETIFILEQGDALKLSQLLLKESGYIDENEVQSTILELSNMLTASCLKQLAEMTESTISFMEPSIDLSKATDLVKHNKNADYDKVVIVNTMLDLPDEGIKGSMFILNNTESFTTLTEILDNMV